MNEQPVCCEKPKTDPREWKTGYEIFEPRTDKMKTRKPRELHKPIEVLRDRQHTQHCGSAAGNPPDINRRSQLIGPADVSITSRRPAQAMHAAARTQQVN